jgi:hypothetical protein
VNEQLSDATDSCETAVIDEAKLYRILDKVESRLHKALRNIRLHKRGDSVVAVYVDVEVEMTNLRDAILRPFAAARMERIGSDIDVRTVVVLIAQPR